MAHATVADIVTVVAVPLVLNASKAPRAGLGALAVGAGAIVVFLGARALDRSRRVRALRRQSKRKSWALDLRASLAALFALCALAQAAGTSIMIAGFAAG